MNDDSFHILRPINFVHVVHQIGGGLYNPPTTKHGGSSSRTPVIVAVKCSESIVAVNVRNTEPTITELKIQRRAPPPGCIISMFLGKIRYPDNSDTNLASHVASYA